MLRINCASDNLTANLKKVLRKIPVVIFLGIAITSMACNSAQEIKSEKQIESKGANVNDLNAEQKEAVLNRLAELLEDFYVFPDKGDIYAQYLRQRTSKLSQSDKEEFATQITEELREIHTDAHLRLEIEGGNNTGPEPNTPPPPKFDTILYPTPEIAYFRFDALWGDPETMSSLRNFVDSSENITTMIIDLRNNRGGGLAEIDFFASELFSDPTDLLIMEVRRTIFEMDGAPFGEGPTLKRIESPVASVRLLHKALPADSPKLIDKKVYILTSSMTASAGEHFALAMQRTGRATLVGESTKGAAHFGGLMPIGSGLRAFIPAGRTYNPDTGESWEGIGVQPDIKSSSDEALIRALEDLGVNSKQAIESNKMVVAKTP
jgi:hypothetical protein